MIKLLFILKYHFYTDEKLFESFVSKVFLLFFSNMWQFIYLNFFVLQVIVIPENDALLCHRSN